MLCKDVKEGGRSLIEWTNYSDNRFHILRRNMKTAVGQPLTWLKLELDTRVDKIVETIRN
jgi:hypothetical protein